MWFRNGFVLSPAFLGEKISTRFPGSRPVIHRAAILIRKVKDHVRLLRPQQWVKNVFVLIPTFFAGRIGILFTSWNGAFAFLAFCAAASAVYIFNDYIDIEKDRLHEKKRSRPLAAGTVPIRNAFIMLVGLLIVAGVFAYALGTVFMYVIGGYLLLNLFYTLYFKHISLVDVSLIAIGFVLRVLAGGVATEITISNWLILMTFLLASCLAVGKRRDDLVQAVDKEALRTANGGYTLGFIDNCLVILGSITIVCYIMYTVSEDVVRRLHSENVYLTSIFVIVGILRFLQIAIVEQKSGAPTMILLRDTMIQAMVGLWFIAFMVILYVR